ncbi:hypothetical protein NSU_3748 [Novosphingobium pentaromativorans US6-1]|uniref:Uncharacterized protein n=1 Tax=Novosphingobium pentaromativorans US6-1 TaxID=1088721 RepID=G6EHC7_9SPHN|nr:hypothetical protein NSU_3748 [Novosphingobium pentaromativorans US6-1]
MPNSDHEDVADIDFSAVHWGIQYQATTSISRSRSRILMSKAPPA